MTTSTNINSKALIAQCQTDESEIIKQIINDKTVRLTVTYESHYLFFHTYFGHYITYKTAEFQKEMFKITEDDSIKNAVLIAFRGSAKSTIMNLSYPIWSIIGKPQKKFVLIVGQTQEQARRHLENIKNELESNELLSQEVGPFKEKNDSWGATSIELSKFGALIMAVSSEQSVRGVRNGQYRPDLIIMDDVEDSNSVRTLIGRNKLYDKITGEIIPAGDKNTKTIIIGNLLHEDSLLMRLKDDISSGKMDGVFKAYPLINEDGKILWPGKFPSMDDIEKLKRTISNKIAWEREFMLRIIPDDGQVVDPAWIKYYDNLPKQKPNYVVIGIDLAISEKESADCTAMVTAFVYGFGNDMEAYILPNPVNERLTFPKTLERIKALNETYGENIRYICIEGVAYQESVIQQLRQEGVRTEKVGLNGQDKRSRLVSTTHYISSGKVLFPSHGAKELIQQLVDFGIEKHDDLADAFGFVIAKLIQKNKLGKTFGVLIADTRM